VAGLVAKVREVCEMHLAETHVIASQKFWKRAWRAGYLETRQSGSGKGGWKRANDQSTGTESVVSIALASPFRDEVTRHLPISCNTKKDRDQHSDLGLIDSNSMVYDAAARFP